MDYQHIAVRSGDATHFAAVMAVFVLGVLMEEMVENTEMEEM